jgi:phosphoglycerate dehydrogenase-like enzyme
VHARDDRERMATKTKQGLETPRAPRIALLVAQEDSTRRVLTDAVTEAGGVVCDPADADGIVWTDPGDPEGLRRVLAESPASWIQLPFAGIEPFVAAGVIDRERVWTCAKGIYAESCAEHALAFVIMAAHHIHWHTRARSWIDESQKTRERRFHANATVAIVGTGGIGSRLARMLAPLEARILGVNRSGRPLPGALRTVVQGDLPEVLPEADFVVLAAALTDSTRGLFDASTIACMRGDAWLVNVARGALVDTGALVAALSAGAIGGAALDVTDPEPLPDDHPLWSFENVIITPHVANTWTMGLPALRALVGRNVARYGQGRPLEGLVDPELGY